MRPLIRLRVVARVAATAVVATLLVAPAMSATATPGMLAAVNAERAAVGVAPLARAADLDAVALSWSRRMAAAGSLSHNPRLETEVKTWRALAENVGYDGSEYLVHRRLMASPGHRTIILNRTYTQVGIGVVSSGGRVWVTQVFRQPSGSAPPPAPPACASPSAAPTAPRVADGPAVFRRGAFFLRLSSSTTTCFPFGVATDVPVMGDWDGDGTRTAGIFRGGSWHLRNENGPGAADVTFGFGSRGDVPVVGDWDGDGVDTVGVVRAGRWHLRDSNSTGPAQRLIAYGSRGDIPVTGDWDGDGVDTLGVVRAGRWFLTDSLSSSHGNRVIGYGSRGDVPVVGDWDGDGVDTVGVFRSGQWLLTNRSSGGNHQATIGFGSRGDRAPVWR